jgi:hypothetical protein
MKEDMLGQLGLPTLKRLCKVNPSYRCLSRLCQYSTLAILHMQLHVNSSLIFICKLTWRFLWKYKVSNCACIFSSRFFDIPTCISALDH